MKIKRLLTLCVLSTSLITTVQGAVIPTVKLNGIESNVSIVKHNGATYVPLRLISEEMGATVEWNKLSQTIKLYRGNDMVACKLNHKTARINSKIVKLEYPPIIQNDTTYVPLRFVAEAFGATVNLNNTTNIVDVTFKKHSGANDTSNKGYKASSINAYGTKFKNPFVGDRYDKVVLLTKADFPIDCTSLVLYDLNKVNQELVCHLTKVNPKRTKGPTLSFSVDNQLARYRNSSPFINNGDHLIVKYPLISSEDFLYYDSWKDFNPSKIEYITFVYDDTIYALSAMEVFK